MLKQRKLRSFLSPKCEVKKLSLIHRFGVFAVEFVAEGEVVALWGGTVMNAKEYEVLPAEIRDFDFPVQISEGFYLGPTHPDDLDEAEFFNHSCEPNAGVKGQVILVARRDILSGEEICFDYEITDSEGLHIICQCQKLGCRKVISGEAWKNPEFQKNNQGWFSYYLGEKIRKLESR